MAGYFNKIIADSHRKLPPGSAIVEQYEIKNQSPVSHAHKGVETPVKQELRGRQRSSDDQKRQPLEPEKQPSGDNNTTLANKTEQSTTSSETQHDVSTEKLAAEAYLSASRPSSPEVTQDDKATWVAEVDKKPTIDSYPSNSQSGLAAEPLADDIQSVGDVLGNETKNQSSTPFVKTKESAKKDGSDTGISQLEYHARPLDREQNELIEQAEHAQSKELPLDAVSQKCVELQNTLPPRQLNNSAKEFKSNPELPSQKIPTKSVITETELVPSTLHIGQINILIDGAHKQQSKDIKVTHDDTFTSDRLFMRSL